MTDEREVRAVLADRPELESALESIRTVDDEQETWTFDDLPIDSGLFGEVVSAGLVEKTDDGYRLPDATRRALDGDVQASSETDSDFELPTPEIDSRVVLAVAGTLALVVCFRSVFSYGAVFRGEHIVLSGNDPYYYRYWVERLLAETGGSVELAVLSEFPGKMATGEPFLIATLYLLSALLGGTVSTAGAVLAWYPVGSALVTGLVLYWLAVTLTADRRIGLAAVVFFATTPAHAMRTSLGYADHHAFDYVWLAVTALALVLLARHDDTDLREPVPWLLGCGLGLGITGQILAWENGPALVLPLALYVGLVVLLDTDAGRSPLEANAQLLGGLTVAAGLVWLVAAQLGWHTGFTSVTPLLLVAGTAGVLLVAEAGTRLGLSTAVIAGSELTIGIGSLALLYTVFPQLWASVGDRLDRFLGTQNVIETQALIAGDLTWFVLLGFTLFLAVPSLVWASKRAAGGSRQWLAASVYTWYFILLGAFQIRFVGELTVFSALFAGFSFVWLAHWTDLAAIPAPLAGASSPRSDEQTETLTLPSAREFGLVLALFVLVGGIGIVQVPIKTGQLTIDDQRYQAISWMSEDAAMANESVPDYVFSEWGRNRVDNYFVNGESETYGYAQQNYGTFLASGEGIAWYKKLHKQGRDGYILTTDRGGEPRTMQKRLHREYGSRASGAPGLGHYRAMYASPDRSVKVFRTVRGALVAGRAPADGSHTVQTDVRIEGASFTYERRVATSGNWNVIRVSYPGTYMTSDGEEFTVTEQDIDSADFANEQRGTGYWPFESDHDQFVFDYTGGNHGVRAKETRTASDGVRGQSLALNGGFAVVTEPAPLEADGFTLSAWVKTSPDGNIGIGTVSPRIVSRAKGGHRVSDGTDGYQLLLAGGRLAGAAGNGTESVLLEGPDLTDGQWHHTALVRNGTTVTLYLDGERVDRTSFRGTVTADLPLYFGATDGGDRRLNGSLDEVRHYDRALNATEIQALAEP